LRWEKETEEKARKTQRRADADQKQRELQFAEADTRARIKVLELDLQRQRAELAMYFRDDEVRSLSSSTRENELRKLRSADLLPAKAKTRGANGSGNSGTGKKPGKEVHSAT
jgi:hypothetical protein